MAQVKKTTKAYTILKLHDRVFTPDDLELTREEPLMIRVDETPYSVVMRTPGQEIFHAAGLCLAEGFIDKASDIETIGYDDRLDPNLIDVWLPPERREKVQHLLNRQTYVSQTSCGICGKKMVEDLHSQLLPAENGFSISVGQALACMSQLFEAQKIYPKSRGSHAALLLDHQLETVSFAEDVGRHNALDKAVGKAFMAGSLRKAGICVMSSRISYELVQKAARAKIPIMISKSRPTALALEMAQGLNMTLACQVEDTNLIVLCGEHRLKTAHQIVKT